MEEKKTVTKKAPTSANKPVAKQTGKETNSGGKQIWHYLWKFRGIIISVPVLLYAIGQAFQNAARLPEKVGMDIQATGEFAVTLTRPVARYCPTCRASRFTRCPAIATVTAATRSAPSACATP